jgi:hypothetical protein
MRLILSGALVVAMVTVWLSLASGQQNQTAEMKHLSAAPLNANRPVSLEALNIERGVEYPSVVRLKGNVLIKTPVCLPVGPQATHVCDGQMIVRADEAEFDEKTGEIRPHGNVVVTPLQHEK